MNDRELLEMAARAAGYQFSYSYRSLSDPAVPVVQAETGRWRKWNPLTEDGDALRLAVRLRFDVSIESEPQVAWWHGDSDDSLKFVTEPLIVADDDLYAETRRAIVRAAAEIGKFMEVGE